MRPGSKGDSSQRLHTVDHRAESDRPRCTRYALSLTRIDACAHGFTVRAGPGYGETSRAIPCRYPHAKIRCFSNKVCPRMRETSYTLDVQQVQRVLHTENTTVCVFSSRLLLPKAGPHTPSHQKPLACFPSLCSFFAMRASVTSSAWSEHGVPAMNGKCARSA